MKDREQGIGHLMASITIIIWGTTFISTKVLLKDFQPVEILFFRFVLGLVMLWIMKPKILRLNEKKQEWMFAGAGLCGICLYYLFENIALTYTQASNVSVIVSISPFFIGILAHLFLQGERLKGSFLIGFVFAIIGIAFISFSGQDGVEMNLKGDLLCVAGAFVWGIYSILCKKISEYGYNMIQTTRRMFEYGILFMIPAVLLSDFHWGFSRFADPVNMLNLLFLGVGACAVCFVTWNYAVKILGAMKTSAYIYVIPVITIVMSVIILHEKMTAMSVAGTILTLVGLAMSEGRPQKSKKSIDIEKNLGYN